MSFFDTRVMPTSWRYAYIVLIPKITVARKLDQFRPTSLYCTLYKIIARSLVSRLKGVIDKLVALGQSAFVPGRSISDGILLA